MRDIRPPASNVCIRLIMIINNNNLCLSFFAIFFFNNRHNGCYIDFAKNILYCLLPLNRYYKALILH